MKLVVSFSDDNSFSFNNDAVCIRVTDLSNLKQVINDENLRNDFITARRAVLDVAYNEDIADEICKVRDLPAYIDFNDFESIKICLNKDVSIEKVYDFLKDFPYKVIVDTDDINLHDVYKLCSGYISE